MNRLSVKDFCEAAKFLNCTVAAIKSVALVESGGRGGFDEKGRVLIRYEGHKFREATGGKYDASHPTISYHYHKSHKNCGKEHGYTGFNIAFALDPDAAMEACSIGMFQPMVFNFRAMGYADIHAMWDDFKKGEGEQLLAFCRLIKKWKLDDELRRATLDDFTVFARMYNGASFRDNNYHHKMFDGFRNYSREQIDCSKISAEITADNIESRIDDLNTNSDPKTSASGAPPADSFPDQTASDLSETPSDIRSSGEPEPNTLREVTEKEEVPTANGGSKTLEASEVTLPGDAPNAAPRSWFNVEDWKPWVFGKLKTNVKSFAGFNVTQLSANGYAALKSGEYWYVPLVAGLTLFLLSLLIGGAITGVLLLIWYFNRREISAYKIKELEARHDPNLYNFGLKFEKIGECVSGIFAGGGAK